MYTKNAPMSSARAPKGRKAKFAWARWSASTKWFRSTAGTKARGSGPRAESASDVGKNIDGRKGRDGVLAETSSKSPTATGREDAMGKSVAG